MVLPLGVAPDVNGERNVVYVASKDIALDGFRPVDFLT
jgi:hypothetical protein